MSTAKKLAPAKKAAPGSKRAQSTACSQTSGVDQARVGGFVVFGSPVKPTHRTTRQIANAIAALD